MLACHVSVPIPHGEQGGGDEMEKRLTNTMETSSLSSLCPSVIKSLEPAKPRKRVSFDLSETGDGHTGTKKEKVTAPANNKDVTESTAATTITGTGYTATTPMDPEAAKEAVLFMGCSQPLVQLVMDLRHQDAEFHFSNAQQLYQLVCQLVNHPERQARLFKKCYSSQKAESSPASGDPASGTSYTPPPTKAEGDIGQLPLTGMSEGSLRSTTATSSSSSSSSSSPASSLSAAAVATGCCSSEMAAAPGRSEGGCSSLPKIVPSASASEEAGKTTTASSELLPTTPTSKPREEDNVEKNLPKVETNASIVEGAPKSEILETSSKDTAAVTSAAVESKPSDTSKTSSTEQLRERVKALARENWRLTQRKLCRACKKVELSSSGVTFLPCGHFITCEDCSEKFDDCPACGKTIMGTVRTFLS